MYFLEISGKIFFDVLKIIVIGEWGMETKKEALSRKFRACQLTKNDFL